MKFLFDGKYAPLTDRMSFIKMPIDSAIKAFEQWCANQVVPMTDLKTEFSGGFEQLLLKSLPFKYPWRDIFFEATNGWTGHYTNLNTLSYAADNVARLLNATMIYVSAWPSKHKRIVNGWGGGVFSFYVGNKQIRHMMLSDQDRWEFDNFGEPFPFEDVEKYKEKFARNRFTPEMLDKYLKEFGIDFFNEDFYMPPGSKAYIIEQVRPPHNEDDKPISLEEMRKRCMYE
ncbi:MAG: hypothetical protein FWH23_08540 [Bacteroidales bacterium]|nr:hypothetical protein [Bacteroidales bacterium]